MKQDQRSRSKWPNRDRYQALEYSRGQLEAVPMPQAWIIKGADRSERVIDRLPKYLYRSSLKPLSVKHAIVAVDHLARVPCHRAMLE
jgi:hypothetical protein